MSAEMADQESDFVVIGAGIAGASVAYELATEGRVVLLEREERAGYHTTGRSAALYSHRYKNPTIRGLAIASGDFLENPPAGFTEHPLLTPRGLLVIARADQKAAIDGQFTPEQMASGLARELTLGETIALASPLDPDYVAHALYMESARDIDVHNLHQGYLNGLRARGGTLVTDAGVQTIERDGANWRLRTGAGEFTASVVVNAAGAWADELAERAGLLPIGLTPMRRTVITFDPPAGTDPTLWPMVMDAEEKFYFKPEAGRVLASPCDETPVPPSDVQPEEIDVAYAVDFTERATNLKVSQITHRWAGLRSFVADKMPVIGMAPDGDGFLWLAGQGGFGIMTAPAMARAAAALALGRDLPADISAQGVAATDLSPQRLQHAR
jgi:D-arginine dehydrogenase